MSPLLESIELSAGYHGHPLVHDLNLVVDRGQVVALLGPNGAGKTTTLLTLAGELESISGVVKLDGSGFAGPLHRRARNGLSFVTEERAIFMALTVRENLQVGRCRVERALELFPELLPLLKRQAGRLSGGEQQMLALARALARHPSLLFVDELSLGLAPLVVERLLRAVRAAADEGCAVLLIEQQMTRAMEIADYVYVLRQGRLALQGTRADVADQVHIIEEAYLHPTSNGQVGTAAHE